MPNFHLQRQPNNRDKTYQFIDRLVRQHLYAGGFQVNIYRYLGPKLSDGSIGDITSVMDPVLMENSVRAYSTEIVTTYASTIINRNEFSLFMMGMSPLSSEIIQLTFHYNDMIERMGRKLLAGDIIEVSILRDIDLLDPNANAINRFFVVTSSQKDKNTYAPGWSYHLWSVNVEPLTDSPEYADFLKDKGIKPEDTTYGKEIAIMDQLLDEAEGEVDYINQDNTILWVDLDENGELKLIETTKNTKLEDHMDGSQWNYSPIDVDYGLSFPAKPQDNQYFLRIDYNPPRLFKYNAKNGSWYIRSYDNRRKWTGVPEYLREMINNQASFYNVEEETERSRKALRDVVKSKVTYEKPWEEEFNRRRINGKTTDPFK